MAKAIAAIKYEYKTELIRPLVVMLFRKLENCDEQFLSDLKKSDYIIPVPLYSDRLRNRMFNQAGLIGKHLSKYLAVPVDYGILDRVKPTIPLANLNPKERLRVLKGAFRVVNPSPLEGKKVILVDDILTTGATANECARVLLKAGASCINLITFARA
jgi:ComF family protein